MELVRDLRYEIEVARLTEVDARWRTELFLKPSRIIPFSRLYFPQEGEGLAVLDGREYHLRPGRMYLFPPFAAVHLSCPERMVKYWTHFNAFVAGSDMDVLSLCRAANEVVVDNHDFYVELFRRLVEIHFIGQRPTTALESFEAGSVLGLLLLPFLRTIAPREDDKRERDEKRLTPLLLFIERNLAERLTLAELAKTVHLHPTYLSNLFAAVMGIPLIRYINERRMRKAIKLLWSTELSVAEIADAVGVRDAANFSKAIKRHTGLSPSAYKAQLRKRDEPAVP